MVVLRSISRVNTPPSVSIPSDSGVTSSSTTSLTSPCSTPPWIAAPSATTSSGLTPLWGSFPKNAVTSSTTFGIRVWPPTRITSSMSPFDRPASFSAALQGSMVFLIRSPTRLSSLARVSLTTMCSGTPLCLSIEMNGWLISVWLEDDSSILAFSAASLSRCSAILSLVRSTPCSFLNSSARNWTIRMSKSSPPRNVSPLVDFTSNRPSSISRMVMSKVPPPRS